MKDLRCPQCGYPDLVRARVRIQGGIDFTDGALCVTCGSRFQVGRAVFRKLRYATVGEPYVTAADLHYYMYNFPMTRVQGITCSIASVVGLVVGLWLALTWDQWLMGLVFFPVLYIGWWVGHWISPPERTIPGHCPKCMYNLRGTDTTKCPECGETIDSQVASGRTKA